MATVTRRKGHWTSTYIPLKLWLVTATDFLVQRLADQLSLSRFMRLEPLIESCVGDSDAINHGRVALR